MQITVLSGGVGGARFLLGVREYAREHGAEVSAIVNTGDDVSMHGLRICPDLDSVMYTLAGVVDTGRGWGRVGETWRISDQLAEYHAEPTWFGLGDLDIATHLVRTQLLAAGQPLSAVTARLCRRWQPGIDLLPMTDERCETHVVIEDGRTLHFQEWWVRHRAQLPAVRFVQDGVATARPAPGVLEAIADADVILIAPSNPVVSIQTILGVPGITEAIRDSPAAVVGLSPIIAGAPVRGMADQCLPVIGVETSAAGVAGLYGSRAGDGILDGWLVHTGDATALDGLAVRARELRMTSPQETASMVADALSLVKR